MDYKIVLPVLLSFALSVIMGPVVIPILRKLKMKQTEREDGVQSHLKKAGTPTMGGVIILASIVLTSLFFINSKAKHFDYDAIITGTSMTENFLSSEFDSLFGVNSVKTTFSGASYKEINQNFYR